MELSEALEISRINNVFIRGGVRAAQYGSLCFSSHHLIFAPDEADKSKDAGEFWLLHRAVDRVSCDLLQPNLPSKGCLLTLKCKNFMIIEFEIANVNDAQAAMRSIDKISNITSCMHDYPFYYRVSFTVLDDGWTAFDVEQEFARLALFGCDSFRLSTINEDFKTCPSYPQKVIVPKGIGDDYLKISATFRDGGRFPVLSYFHKETRSSIMRCGQPLIGPTNRRCKEDETILNSLLSSTRGFIVDTRSKNVASSSRSKGGGCESQMYYSQWKYIFCPIPRIQEIKNSLHKMVELCNDRSVSSSSFLSRLAASGWPAAVADCLATAANVAQIVHCEEVPVVVHGGEGTDTTLIATSLARIILDPDARTIRGFESLIEQEWIQAGHPFFVRNAHSAYADGVITGPKESPVFLLFLDCVHQLISQYIHSFEFDESFLIFLFEHAYASEFGSFLGSSEMEKHELQVKKITVSLWSYVNNPEILKTFVNPLYEPRSSVIWPSIAPQSIRTWSRVFFRWQKSWQETDALTETAAQWKLKERELMAKAHMLRKTLIELSKEAALQSNGLQDLKISE
ncbi:hypothetical protein WR25_20585 [Diploscapter pachys]|uniref:Myotubularin phosphatase domain-containing protein n=1 Tax=Diploscapter pachys TaxID=2018661 RepID=A0A2A2K5G1_9BILA|nr:hypothetical protein WR25_20585 [Diploscapter pachys]